MNSYKNNRGFTLIELLIVIALMAIMMAFAAPSMVEWRQNTQIKEVARDILGGLRQARSLAVTNNQNVTATIDLDNHTLTYNGTVRTFPANITIEADNDVSLVGTGTKVTIFYPQGSCSNQLYIQVNNDPNLLISIESAATALARIE